MKHFYLGILILWLSLCIAQQNAQEVTTIAGKAYKYSLPVLRALLSKNLHRTIKYKDEVAQLAKTEGITDEIGAVLVANLGSLHQGKNSIKAKLHATDISLEVTIDQHKIVKEVVISKWLNGAGNVGKYSLTAIKSEIGFVDLVVDLIKKEGLSLDDFKYMMQKNVNALTDIEKSKLANIRNALSKPNANIVMQKVITKNDIQKYLNGDNNVGGFVSRAADAKHLETFEDLYHGLRLDYNKTTFFIEDGSCGVIRFKSSNSSNAIIPSGGTYDAWDYPFTATGFTSGKSGRLGVPEWHLQNRVDFSEGAEIWQVSNNETEKLIATYDETLKKFIAK
jgi:hypothetical protein